MNQSVLSVLRGVTALCLGLGMSGLRAADPSAAGSGGTVDFSEGWRFYLGDAKGAEAPVFDDAGWRALDLPHDWSIELPQDQAIKMGTAIGNYPRGTGWYRKHFALTAEQMRGGVDVIFDGVQQLCEVWINGHYLGLRPNGYVAFFHTLTPYLRPAGADNVIAVRAECPPLSARWYPGSGIYRPVQLRFRQPIDLATWGLRLNTLKRFTNAAQMQVLAELRNDTDSPQSVGLALRLHKPDATTQEYDLCTVRLAPRTSEQVGQLFVVTLAEFWSPESPVLYTAELRVLQEGRQIGGMSQAFGIRDVKVSAADGFQLNGTTLKLHGGNLHHDNGVIGAAAFAASEWRRVELMKKSGFNAIRTSHNPPSAAFLEACDHLGMLVMDEFVDLWQVPKTPGVMSNYSNYFAAHWEEDLRAMIARDYNHPSVVIWSIGNEIPERFMPAGLETARHLTGLIRSLDPQRPLTMAFNKVYDTPSMGGKWERTGAAPFAALDIAGYNYLLKEYDGDHARHPDRIMAGTETYPQQAFENWQEEQQRSYLIGSFVWTGMDHLGESGVGTTKYVDAGKGMNADPRGSWPYFINWSGDIDLIGNKKPQSYYRDILWDISPVEIMIHRPIPDGKEEKVSTFGWPDELPSWTWAGAENKTLDVRVFSKAPRVRLELNGKAVGEALIDGTKGIVANFKVPYAAGELKAVALGTDGKEIGSRVLTTSGAPAGLAVTPELKNVRAGRDQVIYVPLEVRDGTGKLAEQAAVPLKVVVSGAAELLGLGTANPTQIESFKDSETISFRGRALLVLRSTGAPGRVQVSLGSPDLTQAEMTFEIP
jgi:beta-galactosidase